MNLGWIIFRDGIIFEIVEDEKDFAISRVKEWSDFDTVSTFTLSEIGYPILRHF